MVLYTSKYMILRMMFTCESMYIFIYICKCIYLTRAGEDMEVRFNGIDRW
jgi:hypothetical protein